MKLSAEQHLIFNFIRSYLDKPCLEKTEEDLAVNFDRLEQEVQQQAVFLVACEGLTKYCERLIAQKGERSANGANQKTAQLSALKKTWKKPAMDAFMANHTSLLTLSDMHRVMSAKDFDYVILKGLAAAAYYPAEMDRALGDVDFLIDPRQQNAVEAALESEGFKNWEIEHICHVVFSKPGQHLEMHFEISGIPYGRQGEIVRDYMKNAAAKPVLHETMQGTFHLPQPKYHGLILLLHMQHHMLSEGIGLRHLMDWGVFADKTKDEAFWTKDLIPVLKEIGLFVYARVMTKTASIYFGTSMPEWCEDADDALCDEVMADILEGGNFGSKNTERASSGMLISEHGKAGTKHGKFYNFWRVMCKAVQINHPSVRKHVILYPFFSIEVIVKRLFREMTGQRIPIYKGFQYADERKSVYDRLKVFEVKEN